MTLTHSLLKTSLALVCLDGILETALAESCLWWIHFGAAGPYHISDPFRGGFTLPSQPRHMLFSLPRAASAAGILAFLSAAAGLVALALRRSRFRAQAWTSAWCRAWPCVAAACAIYTLAVTVALNVVTDAHDHQTIDVSLARDGVPYPLDSWALPNFYGAVRMLLEGTPGQNGTVRTIDAHLWTMLGWRWNLVPSVILQVGMAVLGWVEGREWMRRVRMERAVGKGLGDIEGGSKESEDGILS